MGNGSKIEGDVGAFLRARLAEHVAREKEADRKRRAYEASKRQAERKRAAKALAPPKPIPSPGSALAIKLQTPRGPRVVEGRITQVGSKRLTLDRHGRTWEIVTRSRGGFIAIGPSRTVPDRTDPLRTIEQRAMLYASSAPGIREAIATVAYDIRRLYK